MRLTLDADEDTNLLLLNLMYGHDCVQAVIYSLGNVPNVLASPTRFKIAAQHSELGEELCLEVCTKLQEYCPSHVPKGMPRSQDAYILTPPTGVCINGCITKQGDAVCLEIHHKPCNVKYVSSCAAPIEKKKISLRCTTCKTNYHFSSYGNKTKGYQFYDQPRDAISATDQLIVDSNVFNLQWALR
jgi:hypothetical protein